MTGVSSQVDALSNTVDGIINSLTMLGENGENLEASLMSAQSQLASITAALEGVVTSEELGLISNTLADLQADVREILENNAIVTQNITINSIPSLELAETLIDTAADAPNIILDGTLTIDIGVSTFNAAELARVNEVTAKLATILDDVTIENDQATVTIALPNLVFVDGWFDIINNAVDIPLLSSITGSAIFDYKGAINRAALPSISEISGNVEVNKAISLLDLTGINVNGSISSVSSFSGELWLTDATTVNAASAEITNLNAPKATTITMGHEDDLTSLTVFAPVANTIDIATDEISGTTIITAGSTSTVNLTEVTTAGLTSIIAGTVNFAKLTKFGAAAVVTATTVSLSELTTNASGTLTFPTATSFVAPKLSVTLGINAPAATTVEIASSGVPALNIPAVETLSINKLGNKVDFSTAGFANLETFTMGGATGEVAPNLSTKVTNTVMISGGSLESVTISGGDFETVVVSGTGNLTSLSTAGNIVSFTVNDADKLTSATLGHAHIEGHLPAELHITNNAKLASLTTSNLDEVGNFNVSYNAELASLNLASFQTIPLGGSYHATITNNKLTGDYIEAVAGTLTTPYVEAQVKSNDLNSLKPYFQLAVNSRASATTGNVTYTLNINLSDADAATTGAQDLSSEIAADTNAAVSGPPANGTGLATPSLLLDTNFVALVQAE